MNWDRIEGDWKQFVGKVKIIPDRKYAFAIAATAALFAFPISASCQNIEIGPGGVRMGDGPGRHGERHHGWRGEREHGWRGEREHGWRGEREHGWRGEREHGRRGEREHDE